MQNVLIVGGAGYTGGALVDLLTGSDYNVRGYDNLLDEHEYRKPVDFVFGDLRDERLLKPQLRSVEHCRLHAQEVVGHATPEGRAERSCSISSLCRTQPSG